MAFSYATYTGNGANRNFSVPFNYISQDHVTVTVDGVEVTFTWLNSSTVQTTVAPANATLVEVRRTTPKANALVDFEDASTLTESDLDLFSAQMLYIAQEAYDTLAGVIGLNDGGNYDANSRRIVNVANPVDNQDAATKVWTETAMTSQVVQATTAQTAASASATAAAADRAVVAADKATVAADKVTVAADKATVASDKAAAATSASSASSSATSAATSATNAASSATSAASSASAASTSATSAATSASDAAALLDSFDDRYLGPKSANPTLDNDGNALVAGQLYYNTTSNEMRVYSGSAWQVAYNPSLGAVDSVFGRLGAVTANSGDYTAAQITNTPSGNLAASTVQGALNELQTDIDGRAATSHTHAQSDITGLASALSAKADLASPALTGNPTAPTQSQADNTTKIATTAYVRSAIDAVLNGVSSAYDTLAEIATWIGTTGTAALKNTGTSGANVPLMSTTNQWSKQQYIAEVALTDAANTDWDCDNAVVTWSVGGARTLNTASNQKAGGIYTLQVTNSTGTASIAFNSSVYKGVTGYVLTAGSGKVDELTFRSNGTVMRLIGVRQDIAG